MARDYKKEYERDHSHPSQIAARAARNAARVTMGLKKGDGKEVDHKRPLSKGGSTGESNLRVISRHSNRVKASR